MFNIGPLEFVVLAAVALIVFGPDKLPQLTKDAASMLRTLRDLAQGARSQLNDELGPEFADFDLSSLNPRTAIKNALLGDEDFSAMNPRTALQRAMRGEDEPGGAASANGAGTAANRARTTNNGAGTAGAQPGAGGTQPGAGGAQRTNAMPDWSIPVPPISPPLPEGERPPFDADAT